MEKDMDNFELDYKEEKIRVQKHAISGQVIFRIQFLNKKAPLIITRTNNPELMKFWTSVPEGRQKDAEEIGPLIEQYFRTNK
jgi:hypothetical protein